MTQPPSTLLETVTGEFASRHGHGRAVDPQMSFATFGLAESTVRSFLLQMESLTAIPLPPHERRAAVSIARLVAALERQVAEALLSAALPLPTVLDWAAAGSQDEPGQFRFRQLGRPARTVSHAVVLGISARVARDSLAPRVRAVAGAPAVVIRARDPFVQTVAFLAALRCGAPPLVVAPDALPGNGCPPELLGPGRSALLVTDTGTPAPGLRPDVVLSPEPALLSRDHDPAWMQDGAPAEVAWFRVGPGHGRGPSVRPVTAAESLAAVDDLVALAGRTRPGTMISCLPLHHELGVVASILWPMLLGGSSVLMPAGDLERDSSLWVSEVCVHGSSIGLAPPGLLAATARTDATAARRVDLSGLRILATAGAGPHDPRLSAFRRRFARSGFSPSAFRFDPRLDG